MNTDLLCPLWCPCPLLWLATSSCASILCRWSHVFSWARPIMPNRGLPSLHHHEVCDWTATLLTEACHSVVIEPGLQHLGGDPVWWIGKCLGGCMSGHSGKCVMGRLVSKDLLRCTCMCLQPLCSIQPTVTVVHHILLSQIWEEVCLRPASLWSGALLIHPTCGGIHAHV